MAEAIILLEDGETIQVKDVRVQDEDVYQFLKQVDEDRRVDQFVTAIRIGVAGLKRMGVAGELDYVQQGFRSLLGKFEKQFDPDVKTSYLGKLTDLLGEYFDKGGTVENLLDPTLDDTPLGRLRKGLHDELAELKKMLARKGAEEELVEATTLKGFAFEDACEEVLSLFVSHHMGDELERTTDKVGAIEDSRAGDFVITLNDMPDKRIVLETKDRGNMTQPMIMAELERAMKNRDASYGICVSKYKEQLPKKIGWFNEFRGNMLVCALGSTQGDTVFLELLNVACQWAKLRMTKEMTVEEKALEALAHGIREIERNLNTFSQIKTQCTNLDDATSQIREISDALKGGIEAQITNIKKAIATLTEEETE